MGDGVKSRADEVATSAAAFSASAAVLAAAGEDVIAGMLDRHTCNSVSRQPALRAGRSGCPVCALVIEARRDPDHGWASGSSGGRCHMPDGEQRT